MSKRIFIIIGAVIVLLYAFAEWHKSPQAVKSLLTSASQPKSAFVFTADEIEAKLKKIEDKVPEIAALLKQYRYQDARGLFDNTFYELRRAQHENGDKPLERNRSLGGELKRLEGRVAEVVSEEFQARMRNIERGQSLDTLSMQRLLRSFASIGEVNFDREFARRAAVLDRERRKMAVRWIRLEVDAKEDDYEFIVSDLLTKAISLPREFAITYGPPVGPAEKEATFMTISVKVATEVDEYRKIRRGEDGKWNSDFFHDRMRFGLLKSVGVVITMKPAFRGYATSWDALLEKPEGRMNISVEIPTPERFEIPAQRDPGEEFKERNVERVEQMKGKLTRKLAEMPALNFAPDTTSPVPPLSRQAALTNAPAFASALTTALSAKQPSGAAAPIAVELMIESVADRIESRLAQFTSEERWQLTQALAVHPWYHGYGTLAKLVATSDADQARSIIEAMKRDLDQAPLRKAALARILQEKPSYQQSQMMEAFMAFSPADSLADVVKLYPGFPTELQSSVLTSLAKRDRVAAAEFARKLIGTGRSETVKLATTSIANALSSINSGRQMTLLPEEMDMFIQAVGTAGRDVREEIISRIPESEELLEQFRHSSRGDWSEAENLALFDRYGTFHFNSARDAEIAGEILQAMRKGRLKSKPLAQKGSHVLSRIMNGMLVSRGDEALKIPLIMQIIDERSSVHMEIYKQSIASMVRSVTAPIILQNQDGHALLAKGRDYPDDNVQKKIRELIVAVADTDARFQDLR